MIPAEGKPEHETPIESAELVTASALLNEDVARFAPDGFDAREIAQLRSRLDAVEQEAADIRAALRQAKHALIREDVVRKMGIDRG